MSRIYSMMYPPTPSKEPEKSKVVKFGILGAAAIAPPALINPAKSHPEVAIYAIAARDKGRASAFGKKHGIEKVYGGTNGYQELLDDPNVDAVYNPLPNGLHFEWTMKALLAGKHVLLEKPAADTAEETRQMYDLAEKKNLVLLEAFHYRFHPTIQRAKNILASGELGQIKSAAVEMAIPRGIAKANDIRFNYGLGGGAMMDMGCYTLNTLRYLTSSNPTSVDTVEQTPVDPNATQKVDRATKATLTFPNDVKASLFCDLGLPPTLGVLPKFPKVSVKVECKNGSVEVMNHIMPTIYHSITVTKTPEKGQGKRETKTEKVYTFKDGKLDGTEGRKSEAWWTTYRYQLEAFVDKVKGREPQTWVDREDTVENMKAIEMVYEKSGFGVRPKSEYVPASS